MSFSVHGPSIKPAINTRFSKQISCRSWELMVLMASMAVNFSIESWICVFFLVVPSKHANIPWESNLELDAIRNFFNPQKATGKLDPPKLIEQSRARWYDWNDSQKTFYHSAIRVCWDSIVVRIILHLSNRIFDESAECIQRGCGFMYIYIIFFKFLALTIRAAKLFVQNTPRLKNIDLSDKSHKVDLAVIIFVLCCITDLSIF